MTHCDVTNVKISVAGCALPFESSGAMQLQLRYAKQKDIRMTVVT